MSSHNNDDSNEHFAQQNAENYDTKNELEIEQLKNTLINNLDELNNNYKEYTRGIGLPLAENLLHTDLLKLTFYILNQT